MAKPRYPAHQNDPSGKPLCRGCGAPVPRGRQTWCSSNCYETRCPQRVIYHVEQRDRGICARCGTDTEALHRSCRFVDHDHHGRPLSPAARTIAWREAQARAKELHALGWPDGCRRWWEGDHIMPHSEGGEMVLENIRTLCTLCHKQRTRTWHRIKSEDRKGILSLPGI